MTLNLTAELPYWDAKRAHPKAVKIYPGLQHTIVPLNNAQARLKGKKVLRPEISLDKYKFKAVIDWIEIEMSFARKTQVQYVQDVLRNHLPRNSHIDPISKGPGDTFYRCTIKIQDPDSLALVTQINSDLVREFGETKDALIVGIEVSVDATPSEPSDEARALMVGSWQRTIWTDRDIWSNKRDRPRSVTGKRSASGAKKKNPLYLSSCPEKNEAKGNINWIMKHFSPFINGTMYLGQKEGDVMIRIMDKILDTQHPDETADHLAPEHKRARIEVTLLHAGLRKVGLSDITSLRNLNVAAFQRKFFQFKLPTLTLHDAPTDLPRDFSSTVD